MLLYLFGNYCHIQNNNHIKCLQSLLTHYPDEYFKSIIVFADTCKFKYNNNSDLKYDTRVVNYKELKGVISQNAHKVVKTNGKYIGFLLKQVEPEKRHHKCDFHKAMSIHKCRTRQHNDLELLNIV